MAKLVQIARGVAINPDHVTAVRRDNGGFYIEMTTGTRHQLREGYDDVIAALNGGTR